MRSPGWSNSATASPARTGRGSRPGSSAAAPSACPPSGHRLEMAAGSGRTSPPGPPPTHPQAPATHRDMQLRKSLSCSSSESTLALLLVLTRILAFLTLSKGPTGSEREATSQGSPDLHQEATEPGVKRTGPGAVGRGVLEWRSEPWRWARGPGRQTVKPGTEGGDPIPIGPSGQEDSSDSGATVTTRERALVQLRLTHVHLQGLRVGSPPGHLHSLQTAPLEPKALDYRLGLGREQDSTERL